jgi:hypothetical protein
MTSMARYTEVVYPVKKLVPLTTDMADAISEYRHQQRVSSENEAIRRLIEAGLKAVATAPLPSAPTGGSNPGGARKPATTDKSAAPAQRKPGRQAVPAQPQGKEAQIRALREQGAGQ